LTNVAQPLVVLKKIKNDNKVSSNKLPGGPAHIILEGCQEKYFLILVDRSGALGYPGINKGEK